jgi:dihydroorotase
VIATDHAPHDPDSKCASALAGCFRRGCEAGRLSAEQGAAFTAAANGVIGLETSLGLALELVRDGVIGPMRLIEMMALNPARLLGLEDVGRLFEGGPADVTVIDPERTWEVIPASFLSRSRNTPFSGRTLKGRAVLTIVDGKIVYDCRAAGL